MTSHANAEQEAASYLPLPPKSDPAEKSRKPRKRLTVEVAEEGVNGYAQSWYPLCFSSDVKAGDIKGVDFLNGRVIVFRAKDGSPRVMSAYCSHLGADLAAGGELIDDRVRCPFHYWEYDTNGQCSTTGIGDPVPPGACLFKFPACEKFGLIWAFNGEEALWEMPQIFPYSHDQLWIMPDIDPFDWPVDPWVLSANTPDWNHLRVVHGLESPDFHRVDDIIKWHKYGFHYHIDGVVRGVPISYDRGILGTTIFYMYGIYNGKWFGALSVFNQPKKGHTIHYPVVAILRSDAPTEAERDSKLKDILTVATNMANEDKGIMQAIRYRRGTLTKVDSALAKFFDYVRNYPRANPAEDFLR